MAFITGAAIGAGANLIGGIMGSNSAKKAAEAQAAAAREQLALQRRMYEETTARNQPFYQSGVGANNRLATLLGTGGNAGDAGYGSMSRNFSMDDYLSNQDPSYQFGMTQGQNALNAQNAATGGAQSGAAMKAAARYGQDYAGTKYNEAFNRYQNNRSNLYNMLSGQGNVGLSAANNTSAAGNNYATGGGAALGNIGAANASGYMGSSNAYSNAIGNAMNNYNNMSMMNRMFPGQGSPTPQQPMAPSYDSQNTVLNPNYSSGGPY
jgi:hypothetical protein